jgi:hypothetical protein
MRSLIIGYGNPSRRDDGVGLAVVNGLRQYLGQQPLEEGDDGSSELGDSTVGTLFLEQLIPELAETLAAYDRVWFVDAHLGVYPELVPHTARAGPRPGNGGPPDKAGHVAGPGSAILWPCARCGADLHPRLRLRLWRGAEREHGRGREAGG